MNISNTVNALKSLLNKSSLPKEEETDLFGNPVENLPPTVKNENTKKDSKNVEGLSIPDSSEDAVTGTGDGPEL